MRILVFSQAAWNTSNSFGNTVTNWFDGWKDAHFFHFYARQQKPNTSIVEKYYNVSAIEILKKTLLRQQSGRILNPSDVVETVIVNSPTDEQKRIAIFHRSPKELLYWVMEKVWYSGKWINETFDEFVKEADPDILFAFATSPYILEPAIKYIKAKKPSVKVVLWIADDILGGYEQNAWYRRRYLKSGIDYCFHIADRIYGASAEMCEKYSSIYGKDITPLYKGCSFERPVKESNNSPLRLVYAGNLLYGRKETLKEIIKALRTINSVKSKAVLEVYSNTPMPEEEKHNWFDDTNAFYMGIRPYDEIKEILNEADIVLHIESFEKNQMKAVKYSFSTKIIDCLQSGSVLVGIGPAKIASIEYIKGVDGAVVIDDLRYIFRVLNELICEPNGLYERARSIRNYSINNHEISNIQTDLHSEFELLAMKQKVVNS